MELSALLQTCLLSLRWSAWAPSKREGHALAYLHLYDTVCIINGAYMCLRTRRLHGKPRCDAGTNPLQVVYQPVDFVHSRLRDSSGLVRILLTF